MLLGSVSVYIGVVSVSVGVCVSGKYWGLGNFFSAVCVVFGRLVCTISGVNFTSVVSVTIVSCIVCRNVIFLERSHTNRLMGNLMVLFLIFIVTR